METARIVAALVPADARSVPTLVAALLHDVVDDTQVTLSDLRLAFGADVEALVSGVSKLSKLNQQASVFTNVHQRFFFCDPTRSCAGTNALYSRTARGPHQLPRIHFVRTRLSRISSSRSQTTHAFSSSSSPTGMPQLYKRISSCFYHSLHNMRTVWALPPDRAQALAAETVGVWCILAARLGQFPLKSELEVCVRALSLRSNL